MAADPVHALAKIHTIETEVPISDAARRCFGNLEANRFIGTGLAFEQWSDATVQTEVAVLLQRRPDLLQKVNATVTAIQTVLARAAAIKPPSTGATAAASAAPHE